MTEAELASIPLEKPEGAGKLWGGVSHGALLTALKREFKRHGAKTAPAKAEAYRGDADVVVCFRVAFAGGLVAPEGWDFAVAFTQSNARRHKPWFYLGIQNKLTNTGVVFARVEGDRHTKGTNVNVMARRVCRELASCAKKGLRAWAKADAETPTENEYNAILIKLGRKQIVPWSRVGRADRLFHGVKESLQDLIVVSGVVIGMNPPIKQPLMLLNAFKCIAANGRGY